MIYYGKQEAQVLLDRLAERAVMEEGEIYTAVSTTLNAIRTKGDEALKELTLRFDGTDYAATPLMVSKEEIEAAYDAVPETQLKAIRKAIENLTEYHEKQKDDGYTILKDGIIMAQRVRPIKRAGIYVPGGTASYPSSVLMNAIPAKIAGVKEIYMATPAKGGKLNPLTLVAANEAGVTAIFRMGGAQAIAAFAYGTETVPKVDKITGPGNAYVAMAKRQVFGTVGIDSIAGPSEIMVIADDSANPRFVAADLYSQAEHDVLAAAICLTTSKNLALAVEAELARQGEELLRGDIAKASMARYGGIIVLDTIEECVEVCNAIGPEHLELVLDDTDVDLDSIENAGGIFIGSYSPEPLGDYLAGTNHVLPTCGTSRFSSPLGVYDFVKRSSVLCYNRERLAEVKDDVLAFAGAEGLEAHGKAVAIRFMED
ncbi:MAG: histidinol dehydrogenase [Clostridiales bacterium]|nr:histidinol dehydrogenase [Clostridiales bacterium]